ncbi:hypothetical protein TNCV_4831391 [Trichonephila clavipes]|nr:hypothetical protein TNCV_4831391 [Trichonephila clavipes]
MKRLLEFLSEVYLSKFKSFGKVKRIVLYGFLGPISRFSDGTGSGGSPGSQVPNVLPPLRSDILEKFNAQI